jgi:hypothetical protein
MVVGCQPHAPAAFTPRDIPGTHFYEGLSRPQGNGLVGRKYVTEKSSDTTGNRSRDHPASSAALYNYIPETNNVSRVYSIAAGLYLQIVLHVILFRL